MSSYSSDKSMLKDNCKLCGKPVEPIYMGDSLVVPLCSCQREAKYKEAIQSYENNRLKAVAEEALGINPKIKDCTFESYKPRRGVETALALALDYSENIKKRIESGRGITFLGDMGTGKSHLCGAIAQSAVMRGYVVVYEVVTELLCKIRNTYFSEDIKSSEASELKILDTICACDLLILDDLGAEKSSPWTQSIIYMIVNRRYVLKKPILISTNLELKELSNKIGERAFDRLIEMNRMVRLTGESYRMVLAKERMSEEKHGAL